MGFFSTRSCSVATDLHLERVRYGPRAPTLAGMLFIFLTLIVSMTFGYGMIFRGLNERIDLLSDQLESEILYRRMTERSFINDNINRDDTITRYATRLHALSKDIARIDSRITEFNNACDLYCSRSSSDHFNLSMKINKIEEDNIRQESLIKGLFHNFDIVWMLFSDIDGKIAGLVRSIGDHYNCHKCRSPSIQRIRLRR